jgi:2-keto-4-pentenoate hydratase/2-oxohepta-3-ene-1,7-dioic acid hydratase in catechol pathway
LKIICIDDSGFFIKPDTALLRNNEPFWMPAGARVEGRKGRVVRIGRVAKCVNQKFAHRCYGEMGAAVDFMVRGAECEAAARAFDHSLAVSPAMVPCPPDAAIDSHIAHVTRFVTLKIGDLLFIPDGQWASVHAGDRIEVDVNGDKLLDFEIK